MLKHSNKQVLKYGAALALLFTAAPAFADTVWKEVESPVYNPGGEYGTFQLLDEATASGNSFIVAQSNAFAAPLPFAAAYEFNVNTAGNYRVFGRVKAPDNASNSLWVRMDGGAWVRWMDIALGADWHWDFVHDNINGAKPAVQFALSQGTHVFEVSSRESNTKLDLMVFTDDANFSPTAAVSPAEAPKSLGFIDARWDANQIFWTYARGATSYRIERRLGFSGAFNVLGTATDFTFVDFASAYEVYCYRVVSLRNGVAGGTSNETCAQAGEPVYQVINVDSGVITAPLYFDDNTETLLVQPGNNSLNAPPATGRARYDFTVPTTATYRFWAIVVAPSAADDSMWVRIDNGTWFKWNNMQPREPYNWDDINNSDTGGQPVLLPLTAGSHSIEFGYREDGAGLRRILVTSNISSDAPQGVFD
ncbi:MAG: hypothetical protein SF187_20760 [Deltaproteobacteria bacterium]|nr:hypothetical protein [Deltaproteobacteria bacterium]